MRRVDEKYDRIDLMECMRCMTQDPCLVTFVLFAPR